MDLFFVSFFAFALFFAVMLDCINALVPTGPITEAALQALYWPPRPMRELFLWWCRRADPLLLQNPLW